MAPPLTQPCAYGGYGASRLRAGEANQCKASCSEAMHGPTDTSFPPRAELRKATYPNQGAGK